jgi:CBS domain-containing protein
MFAASGMTLKSQIAIVVFVLLCISMIIRLLQKQKITESLFYFWLIVFIGVLIVGVSHTIQNMLTRLIGSYSPLSTMLFLALCFLFGVSMVYSVLISNLGAKIRDITSYVAEVRLDVDKLSDAKVGGGEDGGLGWFGMCQRLSEGLKVSVQELMSSGENMPIVSLRATLREALLEINRTRFGCAGVVDDGGKLKGIVTDGDLRRALVEKGSVLEMPVGEVMTVAQATISRNASLADAMQAIDADAPEPFTAVFVTDEDGRPVGIIGMRDVFRGGLRGRKT